MRYTLRSWSRHVTLVSAFITINSLAWSGTCSSPGNAIQAENCLPGVPQSQWDVGGSGDPSIQGFATDISVNAGTTVYFKIATDASSYRLDIYRIGYYGGQGARLVTTVLPSLAPHNQPPCLSDAATGLLDCGNWAVTASWAVPSNATSGLYFARLVRSDTNGASQIPFIVRNDSGHSDLLFKTSDTTWQAYNDYGGQNLYGCNGVYNTACRAYKVSFNRPFHTRTFEGYSWFMSAEYPMIRWLEANGYDVSYISGMDTDRRGSLLLNHKVILSVGHDEYWSGNERTNILAARDAGVNLAFFSANESFWKTRWENSIDGSNTSYRTLVCYKETHDNRPTDPLDPPTWTGTWRDPRFSPPADGGRPENAVSGTIFQINGVQSGQYMTVSQADGQMRFWRNTAAASLSSGQTYTTPPGTLGFEWDIDADNGFRPAGLFYQSSSTWFNTGTYLLDYGSTYGDGTATHHLTIYRNSGKALVFGAGTVQWSWGLDSSHDHPSTGSDVNLQQATVNLLADMGAQPSSLQSGLIRAVASTDNSPPRSTITSPNGGTLAFGNPIVITGTATDFGGGVVGGVEISLDGGSTWHPATGRSSWSYTWTPSAEGSYTIRTRAVDDSGNLENPGSGVTVRTVANSTPPAPTNLAGTSGNASASLTWSGSSFATGYRIKRSTISGGPYTQIATTSTTIYSDTGLSNGATYYYVVSATNSVGQSSNSNEASVQPELPIAICPACLTIWGPNVAPSLADHNDPNGIEVGVHFRTDVQGYILGIRFYKGPTNAGTHIANLWTDAGIHLASITATNETASGWQTAWFNSPIPINANSNYVASYFAPNGNYAWDDNYFTSAPGQVDTLPLHAPSSAAIGGNGVYAYSASSTMPTGTYQGSNYWVDIVFEVSGVPPQPSNIRATPGNGITTLTWIQAPTATSYTVKRAVLSGGPYAGIAGGLTGTSFVDRGVSNGTKYYYVVSATNPLGEGPNSSEVQSQPEQTIAGCLACYTLWTPDAVPSLLDHNDPNGIEVGVRFQSEVSGYVLGVRFYKGPTNTGTHIANLWTDAGINLARTIANNESASGWQTAWFGNPIPITANAYYVASYFAPNGNYSWDDNYFSFAGLDNSPLHAPETVPFSSGNGVYLYTSSTAFPANTYQGSNYWVDLVFEASGAPFTPTGLNASAANGSVTLNWNASQFAASYNIKRSTSNGGPYTTIATGVTGTSYVNTGVTNGTVYYYVVSAVDKLGESANSSQVSAQPNGPLQINTTSLPSATFGASYSYQLSGGGGAGPYSWTASGLPPFLSIASGGLISGTPFGFGNYTVSVTLTDSAQHSVTRQFNLAISF